MPIVVGSPDVVDSKHVAREINAYCSRGRRLLLVAISVDRALAQFESLPCPVAYEATPWEALCGLVHEPEQTSAVESGSPSPSVVDRIERSFDLLRSETRLRTSAILVGLFLAGSTSVAAIYLRNTLAHLGSATEALTQRR